MIYFAINKQEIMWFMIVAAWAICVASKSSVLKYWNCNYVSSLYHSHPFDSIFWYCAWFEFHRSTTIDLPWVKDERLKGLVHDWGPCSFIKKWHKILIDFLQKVIQKCTNHFGKDWTIKYSKSLILYPLLRDIYVYKHCVMQFCGKKKMTLKVLIKILVLSFLVTSHLGLAYVLFVETIFFRTCRYFSGLCFSNLPRYFLDYALLIFSFFKCRA